MGGPKRPIEPREFNNFMEPIDIGEYRVSRGKTRFHASECPHKKITFDDNERRIWCLDCEEEIDPFEAFTKLAYSFRKAWEGINRQRKEMAEARSFEIRRVATKELDKIWRSKGQVPICPHCSRGLLPEDFSNPPSMSASLERKRREKNQ